MANEIMNIGIEEENEDLMEENEKNNLKVNEGNNT